MKILAETIVSFFDLAEAEGRLLKQKVLHTLASGLLMFVAALMLLVAMGLLVATLYHVLPDHFSPALSLFIMAIFSLLLSGGTLWIALRLNNKP